MGSIVFEIDEKGNRIQGKPNFYGEYMDASSEGNIWIHIYDKDKKDVDCFSRGTIICFSEDDLDRSYNYIIKDVNMGLYRVEEYKR